MKQKKRYLNGSVSVFYVLILAGLISVLFAFMEAARISAIKTNVHLLTGQAADAVYASYQPALWEQYHLLFWQEKDTSGQFPEMCDLQKETVECNWEIPQSGKNFFCLQAHCSRVEITKYQIATDEDGIGYFSQAVNWTRQNLAEDVLDRALQSIKGTNAEELEQNGEAQEREVGNLLEELEQVNVQEQANKASQQNQINQSNQQKQANKDSQQNQIDKSYQQEQVNKNGQQNQVNKNIQQEDVSRNSLQNQINPQDQESRGLSEMTVPSDMENPLTWMKEIRKNGVLALVLPDQKISDKKLMKEDHVHSAKGNWKNEAQPSMTEKLLFCLYCRSHFSDATQSGDDKDKALDYELEYLIGGKEADADNLKAVVNRLLLIREGANLLYLEKNPQKSQEAMQIALAITSAVANPELAEPVRHAILAVWAYAESVSDVRILLDGGKVSLVKTDTQWHTDLAHLSDSLKTTEKNTNEEGLSYSGYLQLLLYMTSGQKLCRNSMELIEKNTGVCMNQLAGKIKCSMEYEVQPLFWNFVQMGNRTIDGYSFSEDAEIIYAN